jgi:hypothetical protein
LPLRVTITILNHSRPHVVQRVLMADVDRQQTATELQTRLSQEASTMTRHLTALAAFALITTGCQTAAKAPVHDTFTKLDTAGGKADSGTIASLAYGKTSGSIRVRANNYGWLQFAGNRGDDVSVWVRSKNGDAVAFVLDANDDVIASNDDADYTTTDSHVTATLPKDGTYYIAFREYSYSNATFTVELAGSGVFSCAIDTDCVAVAQAGCCDNGYLAAVNKGRTADYPILYACDQTAPICSHLKIVDTRVAQCDFSAHKCQMIAPGDIHCGGFINPNHSCPDGWQCKLATIADVGGSCVQAAQ